MLTKLEDQILLTVRGLKDQAYGVSVYQQLEKTTEIKVKVGVVYFALDRLTKRGLLSSKIGEPTAVRGGMRKKYYQLTQTGKNELAKSKKVHDRIWDGFSDFAAEND